MKIACLCPTYKRPRCLANLLACFLAREKVEGLQTRLYVLDDAGQYDDISTEDYQIRSVPDEQRFLSLPLKYNELVKMACQRGEPDAIAIYEDDDIFMPWHLTQMAEAFAKGCRFYRLPTVYSNYGLPRGQAQIEVATGRFHSSWGFRMDLLKELGGWADVLDKNGEPSLLFDQHLGKRARDLDPEVPQGDPSYVYRWGSNGVYHGSQAGDSGYQELWDRLGAMQVPIVGPVVPIMDAETTEIMKMPRGAPGWPPYFDPNEPLGI